jgi:hypothetical protein
MASLGRPSAVIASMICQGGCIAHTVNTDIVAYEMAWCRVQDKELCIDSGEGRY